MGYPKPPALILAAMLTLVVGCTEGSATPTDIPPPVEITVTHIEPELRVEATTTPPDGGPPAGPSPTATIALPTFTPGPTALPPPFAGESIMGIELIGPDFGALAGLASNAGAFWVRWNAVLWSAVEPNQGDRIWGALAGFEQQLLALSLQGLVPIVIVRGTPGWAQAEPGYPCGPILPAALPNFGQFMNELVARYSEPPFNVKYWELGNEPDVDPRLVPPDQIFGCWGDESDAFYGGALYAEMLKVVYPRIKGADPEAQVLTGGLLLNCDPTNPPETSPGSGVLVDCTPSKFLEGILRAGGGDFFDGVSFHAYDLFDPVSGYFGNPNWHTGYNLAGLNSVLVPKTRFIKSVLATYGHSDKYLINTETSLLCGSTGDEPDCNTGAHARMKADYVVISYVAAAAEGLLGNIWFTLDRPWRRSALTLPNGGPTDALTAYQFVAQQLEDSFFWGIVAELEGVTGYKFRRGGQEFWVVWSPDAVPRSIMLPEIPAAMHNSLGTELLPAQTIEIGVSPVYLVFNP
ncbi:MAG TPA: hypothetical protein VMN57_09555 [Anaerolineales bacterium]|nr:hypothetical protein [Anaerolineales bacterium]